MNYAILRSKVQNADVFAFEGRSFFSRLIQLRTHSYITHVGFAIWVKFGVESANRLCVLEAMEGAGVRLVPFSWVLKKRRKAGEPVHWLQLHDEFDREEILGFALEEWGQPYASPIQFVNSFGLLTSWLRRKLGFPSQLDPHRWFCSQIVAKALIRGGFRPIPPNIIPAEVSPSDVFDFSCFTARDIII